VCVCVCVCMSVCVFVCMTDWRGHAWAGLHRPRRLLWCVSILAFTHLSWRDQSRPCDCLQGLVSSYSACCCLKKKKIWTTVTTCKQRFAQKVSWQNRADSWRRRRAPGDPAAASARGKQITWLKQNPYICII